MKFKLNINTTGEVCETIAYNYLLKKYPDWRILTYKSSQKENIREFMERRYGRYDPTYLRNHLKKTLNLDKMLCQISLLNEEGLMIQCPTCSGCGEILKKFNIDTKLINTRSINRHIDERFKNYKKKLRLNDMQKLVLTKLTKPDFMLEKEGEVMFFEVKYNASTLSKNQREFKKQCRVLDVSYRILNIKNVSANSCDIVEK